MKKTRPVKEKSRFLHQKRFLNQATCFLQFAALVVCLWGALPSPVSANLTLVKDIAPGTATTFFTVDRLHIGATLFFEANDQVHGYELWKSDGTESGTSMVKDINPGSNSSNIGYMTELNGILYFSASNGADGSELWRSDGTESGTYMVKNIYPGTSSSSPAEMTVVGNYMYFRARDASGSKLWQSDGTNSGTFVTWATGPTSPYDLININDVLFFAASDAAGFELWKIDGVEYVRVMDINPDAASSYPRDLTEVKGTLFFAADNGVDGFELWKSNGTAGTTTLVLDINGTGDGLTEDYLGMVSVGNTLYFVAVNPEYGAELWSSDGSGGNTAIVKNIRPGSLGSEPDYLTVFNGKLFFRAFDDTNGYELWTSDGTPAGTSMIEINPGVAGSSPTVLTVFDSTMYFRANDGITGNELWKFETPVTGPVLLDVNPGEAGSGAYPLARVNGNLFFSADNGATGGELYKINGASPIISDLGKQFGRENSAIGPLSFTVSDTETLAADLVIAASSDNQVVLPDTGIVLAGTGGNRTISLTPAANQIGSAMVTITVSDGISVSRDIFLAVWGPVGIGMDRYRTIQEAVDAAQSGDTLLAAPGTYTGVNNKNITFSGKAVTLKSERGPELTILDVERGQAGFWFISGESPATVIDGFTITNGFGYPIWNGSTWIRYGGGIYINDSSPTVQNCILVNNIADYGGGLYSTGATSQPLIKNSKFIDNLARIRGGGAAFIEGAPTVEGSFFSGNRALSSGGGLSSDTGISINATSFIKNRAGKEGSFGDGGAVSVWNTFTITNSVFIQNRVEKNSADMSFGGAVSTGSTASGVISHSSFSGNEADQGQAVAVVQGTATITNSILWSDPAESGTGTDGQIYVHLGNLSVENSDIEGGIGGIINAAGSVTSQGININEAPLFSLAADLQLLPGSPAIDAGSSTPVGGAPKEDLNGLNRSLDGDGDGLAFPDMGAYEYRPDSPGVSVSPELIQFSVVKGDGVPDGQTVEIVNSGSNSINWLLDVSSGTEDWLRAGPDSGSSGGEISRVSLYVDAETLSSLEPGSYYASLDIIDEFSSTVLRSVLVQLMIHSVITVHPAGLGDYIFIQEAINNAYSGDVVLVSDGTYSETVAIRGKTITVKSENGPIYTTVDGGGSGRGFIVEQIDNNSVIEGFTITNGYHASQGGGLFADTGTNPTIVNCRFISNSTDGSGGALYALGSVTIRNCLFSGNQSQGFAGGAYLLGDSSIIDNSRFESNSAISGGAVSIDADSTLINNSIITGNTASNYGGGIYIHSGVTATDIYNSSLLSNTAGIYGGAVDTGGSNTSVVNTIFAENHSNTRAGAAYVHGSGAEFINCSLYNNTCDDTPTYYSGIWNNGTYTSFINVLGFHDDDTPPINNVQSGTSTVLSVITNGAPITDLPFIDPGNGDFRIDPASPSAASLIDQGTTINHLFSDQRGSLRPIDGDGDGIAAFDIGAMEFSKFYGGIDGDLPARAFANLRIDSSIVATGYIYNIEWDDRDPFPLGDSRIQQADEYGVILALVSDSGIRHELGTYTLTVSQLGYKIPFVFGSDHIGRWRLRVEMVSDQNQYVLSDPITIEYKDAQTHYYGTRIMPPVGADSTQKPDFQDDSVVFWSADTNRLYAVGGPKTMVITWFSEDLGKGPIPTVASIVPPPDPRIYVTDSMAVPLLPPGTPFDTVEIKFTDNDASTSTNQFSSSLEGWAVLLFKDNEGTTADAREVFEVIRTLDWDHKDSNFPNDPFYPVEATADIGTPLTDQQHDPVCGDGYVFFENSFYDGYGNNKSHDRATRQGPIFPVNMDLTGPIVDAATDPLDDLVVVWYKHSIATNTCWPYYPVRYKSVWPAAPASISIDDELGSGPLPPASYGLSENMVIYDQQDRDLPGFNPNEEHAAFFTAQGSSDPGVFPLRNDINREDTSHPYVLLKFINPQTGIWDMEVYQVLASSSPAPFTYPGKVDAGEEINPPYPLNQMVYGPCPESDTTTPEFVLEDKDEKLFARQGGINVDAKLRYFYKLQSGFYYDLDNDGVADAPDGSCIPWLDGLDGSFDGVPVVATYPLDWPAEVPTLHVGETLIAPKTQAGENVGLPEIGAQCAVDIIYDDNGPGTSAKLIDPLTEYAASYPLTNPENELPLDPRKDLSSGRWVFTALPFHLQTRLTYDEVTRELKLKGVYESGVGEPFLLLNVISEREYSLIIDILSDPAYTSTKTAFMVPFNALMYHDGVNPDGFGIDPVGIIKGYTTLKDVEIKALTAGNAQGTGYVTLAFNNDLSCPAPTMLSVVKVDCGLYRGDIKVIESENPFEEKVTLRHNGDFGGNLHYKDFQWQEKQVGGDGQWSPYEPVPTADSITLNPPEDPGIFYSGAVETIIQGTGQQLLPDRWFRLRYHDSNGVCTDSYSEWTDPQLYEGWIKRVMKKINLFDQKVTDFHTTGANTLTSMISLAGTAYEGDIALSDDPEYLQNLGIIETYETLLNRGKGLTNGIDSADLNMALLFASNRLADLYMLLGNEAYADAADPTIAFSTESGVYGAAASSIFSFQNQLGSLLEEELVLLRGRNATGLRPYYNRLSWNFTLGDGEVAYKENYNITDRDSDGDVDEFDAMIQYPQGHGDAWGHYLSAVKKYYELLKEDTFTWLPLTENILVAGVPVGVDYMDERKFAAAAAARARTGAEIVNLTYRQSYTEDPEGQWQGYKDADFSRSWGVDGWARRAGQGAFFDWVVGNAILPPEYKTEEQVAALNQTVVTFNDLSYTPGAGELEVQINGLVTGSEAYTETGAGSITFLSPLQAGDKIRMRVVPEFGIEKVDRTTVTEFWQIAGSYNSIQAEVDKADVGLNPLGLAKNVIPFDIDPSLVAAGETHFEQIYSRAVQAMNNSIAVFNHANESTQLLRRQQDTLTDFQRNIENMEADFNNRLIEVFGYPYPDDCGPNKTYDTSYCQSGPDLYHYMYVDGSQLMGMYELKTFEFEVTLENDFNLDLDGNLSTHERTVNFHVASDSRFGLIKPSEWLEQRKAPGEIQAARSNLFQTRGRFDKLLQDYNNLLDQIELQADLVQLQYGMNRDELIILNTALDEQISLNDSIHSSRVKQRKLRDQADTALFIGRALAEAFPKSTGTIIGMATGIIVDLFGTPRAAALTLSSAVADNLNDQALSEGMAESSFHQAKEVVAAESNIKLTSIRGGFALTQQLLQFESLIRSEASMRYELFVQAEGLQQSANSYLATLAKGERLLQDRLRFRQQTAAHIQDYRYKDMSFRIFRNDALQKYRAQFDMAAMYVYLAAKAYDYETTLLDYNTMSGRNFLTDIVKQRTIGMIENGQPLTGSGLADPMKRMWQNFQVLKPQLGFNNPQFETNRFSLREELFRIRTDSSSSANWRQTLEQHRVPDLWDIPEYRRYCRPFAQEGIVEPGIVIPFDTTITSGINYFRWPLGGGDSYYDSSNFATKISAVGIWFSNYNAAGLAQTPRVYLVPAGEDILRSPSYNNHEVRSWQVIDQKLPQPFPIVETEMAGNPDWIPTVDTIFEDMFAIRRHSRFRAYHDSGYLNQSEMLYDSRLIGRSAWNTKWLLIIPGRSLLYDPVEGLDTFINGPELLWGAPGERTGNGISDIKLFFETYSYSGN